jgi:hypothetical protein
MLNVARPALALYFVRNSFLSCVSGLQVATQSHVQGDRNAHHN